MTFEAIGSGLHQDMLSEDFKNATWDTDNKSAATSLLNSITDFDYVVVFLTMYQFLSHLSGITVKLQSRSLDIIKAHQEVDDIKSFYKSLRKNIKSEFRKVYQQAERMSASVKVVPSKPRSCSRQSHRPNATAESVEDWFRINVAIPFLDHIIMELDSKFTQFSKTASQLLFVLRNASDVTFSEVLKLYHDDLPSPELFDQELSRWQHKFHKLASKPSSCAGALKECDKASFPNIFILLQIACTIPVTSCECERNASALRRIHNFMRTTMTVERLSSLALMHIHYSHEVNLDRDVDLFAEVHPRRLQFSSILLEPS